MFAGRLNVLLSGGAFATAAARHAWDGVSESLEQYSAIRDQKTNARRVTKGG
jgi:hypothetical protein